MTDFAVIGGGLVGAATAWALATTGREVALFERYAPGHTHGASHGASRIFRHTYLEADYVRLAAAAFAGWRELESQSGSQVLTLTGGITHGTTDFAGYRAALGAQGIRTEVLSAAEAAERWPGLRFTTDVLLEPDTAGRVNADAAVAAFHEVAAGYGAAVHHNTKVESLELRPATAGGGVLIHTADQTFQARHVVVAGGAWSSSLLRQVVPELLDQVPLRVTQEQPAHFQLRAGAPAEDSWPSFVHQFEPSDRFPSGVYGMATPGEGIKAGFHAVGPEVTDPDNRPALNGKQVQQLQDYVATWIPGVDPQQFEAISCTYTLTPSENFLLRRRGPITVGAGFSGHGFKFGPALGRLLAQVASAESEEAGNRLLPPIFQGP